MMTQTRPMNQQTQQLSPTQRSNLVSELFSNNIDLGFCPVSQPTTKTVTWMNPSREEKLFSFDKCPFRFEPSAGRIPPRGQVTISVTYCPSDATVLVASTVLHVINEPDRVVKLSAIGKYPFITINTAKLDFESLIVGKKEVKELLIKNQSPVPAAFQIHRLEEDNFRDHSFSLDYYRGEVPPKAAFLIKVTYNPAIVDLISCTHFKIDCTGGNTVDFECKGVASGVDVAFNQKSVNFGEIKLGQQTSRLLVLQNSSDIPAQFCIFNDKHNIFSFSSMVGTVNPHSTYRLIVRFTPPNTMTYYERIFCIVRNHQLLYVDIMGTCYDLLIRPRPVLQRNIDVFRRKVITGKYGKEDMVTIRQQDSPTLRDRTLNMSTFNRSIQQNPQADSILESQRISTYQNLNSKEGQLSPALPANGDQSMTGGLTSPTDIAFDAPNQVVLHKELILDVTSRERLISLSSELLDFGYTEALTLSHSMDIEITNNLSWKVTIFWNSPKEKLDNGEEVTIFNIYPTSKVIKPYSTESFAVSFRPHKHSFYYFQRLQFFASRYDPKHSDNLLKTKGKHVEPVEVLPMTSSGMGGTIGENNIQSLILEDDMQPPLPGFVNCVGHSFNVASQPFIPNIEVFPSSRVTFIPCSIGESVYTTVQLVNKTDTPTYFKFSQDVNHVFRTFPSCGLIEGKSAYIVILEFSPLTPKTYTTTISCCFNHTHDNQMSFKLNGYCCEPIVQLQNEGQIFFPPSFTGVMSRQNFKLHNRSRISLEYSVSIPEKYHSELYIDPATGILRPNELTYLKCSFIPYRKKNYKITCPLSIKDVVNPQQTLIGYFEPGSGSTHKLRKRQERQYKIETFGVGGDGSLSFEPKAINFGIVKVNFSQKEQVVLENFSNVNFYVEIEIKPKDEKLRNDHRLRTIINKSFTLDFREGIISGNSKLEIGIVFLPCELSDFDLVLECVAKEHNLKGISMTNKKIFSQKAAIDIKARGSYPQLRFVDVRNDSISVSTLWENFSINKINSELTSELTEKEKKYNQIEKLTTEEATALEKQLNEFPWNFGYLANKKPIRPRKVVITVQNVGGTPLDWRFKLPSDDQVEVEPWADPGEPTPEEAFEKTMIERKIFKVEPRNGTLEAGGYKDIALYYNPSFEDRSTSTESRGGDKGKAINEKHALKIVFQVRNGKALGLNLTGMTLAPLQGLLAIRKTDYTLPSVPIGSLVPATFPIEIVNAGSGKINYSADLTSLHNSNSTVKTSSKIFDVVKPDGVLGPYDKSYLQCQFKPLEAKLYQFNIPVIVSDFSGVIDTIVLNIEGRGYNTRPPKELANMREEIPTQRSFVSSIGSKVFFSIEEIDFGEVESQKPEYRLLLLYNAHEEKKLKYDFAKPTLACDDQLTIDPPSGEIESRQFVQIKITLIADEKPTFYEGELSCQITWESEHTQMLSDSRRTIPNINDEDKELLFLRIKKRAKFQAAKKKLISLESIIDADPSRDEKHLFEIIISRAVNDILNDPVTEEMLNKREQLPVQLYGSLDEEAPASETKVSEGLDDKSIKPHNDFKDHRNMFFLNEFTDMVDVVMESTFFNLIQQATLKEIDLLKPSKIFLSHKDKM